MTIEKAVRALIDAGLLAQDQMETAVSAIKQTNVEFTYPDWAAALSKAGLISTADTDKAATIMQDADWTEAEADSADFDKGLENAGLL